MKKNLFLIMVMLILSPVTVFAASYKVDDMTINLDESKWIIFTQENIHTDEKKQALNDLGIDYGYMVQTMTNQNIKVDAVLKTPDKNNYYTEFTIVVQSGFENLSNLHTYSDSKLKQVFEKEEDIDYEIKKINDYKFLAADMYQNNLYVYAIFTVINGKHYTISIKKNVELSQQDKDILNNIVESIGFELDEKYEINSENDSILGRAFGKAIVGALVALILGAPVALAGLFKKKKNNVEEKIDIDANKEIIEEDSDKNDNEGNSFTCDNCGAEVAEKDDKCPKCGSVFVENINKLEEENIVEEQFVCDNCGSLVNKSATRCPECGESFEDENEQKNENQNSQTDVDQIYSDLNKLKKLLDKQIITKAEFEKEKKKILDKK